jgi:hypothetical protein
MLRRGPGGFKQNAQWTEGLRTLTICVYVMGTVDVCLEVLMTRMELEQMSDTKDEHQPMSAERSRRLCSSSYLGSTSFRVLYCRGGARGAVRRAVGRAPQGHAMDQ